MNQLCSQVLASHGPSTNNGALMKTSSLPSPSLQQNLHMVSPALERFTNEYLLADVWNRPGLSTRDRCLATLAVIITKAQTHTQRHYFDKALHSGITPAELSELIAHLAFYTGWGNALTAVPALQATFEGCGVSPDMLAPAHPSLLAQDEAAEAERANTVEKNLGAVAPGVIKYTTEALFNDLWLRPDLSPRDRSLVTVCALTAMAQVAQITFHLNRAMDNGLSHAEASEVFTHLAFYTGWPNVMSALAVVKDVFAKRA